MYLRNEQKKRKIKDAYSGGRWKNGNEYEVMKLRKVIVNHIFKYAKFCKREGTNIVSVFMRRTKCKDSIFGKSQGKPDSKK